MPGGSLSGSYTSLENVYRGTTVPNNMAAGSKNMLKNVKKALSLGGGVAKMKLEPLLDKSSSDMAEVLTQKETKPIPKIMPTSVAEETALLGTVTSDSMDDIELKNIQLQFPSSRRLSGDGACAEIRVRTDRGDIMVAVHGDRNKPAIVTYHDLGLNYVSSFQAFFSFVDMRALLENFCVYHVNAPGQEEGAPSLPDDYVYPTMDELANQINYVLGHFGIKTFIGFGVGAGANILARYAVAHPQKVDALALINCTSTQAGWIEWGYQKMNSRYLRSRGMTQGVLDYLMWHHFGRGTDARNHDLVQVYRLYFSRNVNPTNLSLLIDSYVRRSDLNIARDGNTLKVPVLNITGSDSPHVDDTVTFNGRLDPTNSTWMKISDCGMVLEEQPGKVSEAFRLFLQGEGYAPLSPTKITLFRRKSFEERAQAQKRQCRLSPVIRITENPISEAVVC
ncbi:protein NDRG3 isoform X8 [Plutella xylostella]|uniref:protein NDRG3 isoform X7 n=1 Tax=Plutella xylostella TaxID=51655 RepID=UPI0020329D5F|nr:protein NDRG3 isoform X7 [Plutella xylostella]XP_048488961.1 protein NDRG3 isoform X8 [Plutella xylostella]